MNTLVLTPQWSRIIHRLHGLGAVESNYFNSLAQYSESGIYPRYIASVSETHSESTDGSTTWNFNNWNTGVVRNVGNAQQAIIEFLFGSRSSFCFHSLRIDQLMHNDCLNCLLQLFARKSDPSTQEQAIAKRNQGITNSSMERVSELLINRHTQYHGFELELLTEGGQVNKVLHPQKVTLQRDHVSIHCHNGRKLKLWAQAQSHVVSRREGNFTHTTLIDSNHVPQVNLKIPA